jgi:hypothetical protein
VGLIDSSGRFKDVLFELIADKVKQLSGNFTHEKY